MQRERKKGIAFVALFAGLLTVVGSLVAWQIFDGPPNCGPSQLEAALSDSAVDWGAVDWSPDLVEVRPARDHSWRFMPSGGCELVFVNRPGDPLEPCGCRAMLLTVVSAPGLSEVPSVLKADSSHENYYPVEQLSETHWEETIPVRFRRTSGSIFSWTASGCRYVSIRWRLTEDNYEDHAIREDLALRFLKSIRGTGCLISESPV